MDERSGTQLHRARGPSRTAALALDGGYCTLVDESDLPALGWFSWHLNEKAAGYASVVAHVPGSGDPGCTLILARLLTNAHWRQQVDHINQNPLDNRRENLRLCVSQENTANRRTPSHSRSRFKGINFHKGRWRASITSGGLRTYLGRFDTEEEAAKAYDASARIIHGEFACLNFPEAKR